MIMPEFLEVEMADFNSPLMNRLHVYLQTSIISIDLFVILQGTAHHGLKAVEMVSVKFFCATFVLKKMRAWVIMLHG